MPFTPDKPTPGFQPDKPAGSVSDPQFHNPQPESSESSMLSNAVNFIGGIPEKIQHSPDIIPGMKERRESIDQYRSTPQYQQSHVAPVTGMEDPALNAMGMVSGAPIWALGKYIPGVKNILSRGAQRANVMDLVKNESKLGPSISEYLGGAEQSINAKQITPRMLEQRQLVEGKGVKFDLDSLKGIDADLDAHLGTLKAYQPDPYGAYRGGNALSTGKPAVPGIEGSRTVITGGGAPEVKPSTDSGGYSTITNPTSPPKTGTNPVVFSEVSQKGTSGYPSQPGGTTGFTSPERPVYPNAEIPAEDLMGLREKLNRLSQFKPNKLYTPEAEAKIQAAKRGGDIVRAALNDIHPDMARLSDEMSHYSTLRDTALKSEGIKPITTTQAPIGSDKASVLSQFDEAAGTDLRGLGQDISTAQQRLGQTATGLPTNKYSALQKFLGYGPRAFDAASQGIMTNRPGGLSKYLPEYQPFNMIKPKSDRKSE